LPDHQKWWTNADK